MKKSEMKPYYLKHPVSKEDKAALRAKGFYIIDIAFKPAGWVDPLKKKQGGDLWLETFKTGRSLMC